MIVAAFDLSLTRTGWAVGNQRGVKFGSLETQLEGMERLNWLMGEVHHKALPADLVIFEDLAFAAHDRNHERAGLAMLVRHKLWSTGQQYVVVAPATLKKFVTGVGKGEKSQIMLSVYKRWKHDVANDDEADALGLFHIGMMLTGQERVTNQAARDVQKVLLKSHPWLKELQAA